MPDGVAARACGRCHTKKVKCSGFPGCRNCAEANVECEPHTRRRKDHHARLLKAAEDKIKRLEEKLHQRSRNDGHLQRPPGTPAPVLSPAIPSASTRPVQDGGFGDALRPPNSAEASDISLLAINATGEQRYLGPSSGSFFATYAASILRSCALDRAPQSTEDGHLQANETFPLASKEGQLPLRPNMVKLLQKSFEMWVNPIYPLMSTRYLSDLVSRCHGFPTTSAAEVPRLPESSADTTLFYLVMAIGAANYSRTLRQLNSKDVSTGLWDVEAVSPSPAFLYSVAMESFDKIAQDLRPSVSLIQMLLLVCIYSSHNPLGPSQWQLAGFAMRSAVEIGLHYSMKNKNVSEEALDERNRIFWTAYAIEMTISYNLGRPPSISDEHITATLPAESEETLPAILHIKHRQIQSRIVSQVYCAAFRARCRTVEERRDVISKIQAQLDEWRAVLKNSFPIITQHPYPYSYWDRLYHGTTFVLHRTSPLCPSVSEASSKLCIRAAGGYIDNVYDLLRTSNVPISWMLVQGVLYAALTMLVMSQTCFTRFPHDEALSLCLVDCHAWSRKCAVCLAIMNERWGSTLLSRLSSQYEILADNTLRVMSIGLIQKHTELPVNETLPADRTSPRLNSADDGGDARSAEPPLFDTEQLPGIPEAYECFTELFGEYGNSSFWEIFPQDIWEGNAEFNLGAANTAVHSTFAGQGDGWGIGM